MNVDHTFRFTAKRVSKPSFLHLEVSDFQMEEGFEVLFVTIDNQLFVRKGIPTDSEQRKGHAFGFTKRHTAERGRRKRVAARARAAPDSVVPAACPTFTRHRDVR